MRVQDGEERPTATRAEPVTTCVDCPAYGTDACEILEGLGSYCDVMLAASEVAVRRRATRPRSDTRRPLPDRVH